MICPNCGNDVPASMKFCSKCGTPMSAPQMSATPYTAPASQQAQQPMWSPGSQVAGAPPKRKSRAGKILLIVGIVFILLLAGIGTAIYFGVRSYMQTVKNSAPYALAESTLRESPVAKERLGEIKSIGIPLGTYKEEPDGTGFAAYTMSVEGEKASGQYVAAMDRRKSVWHVQRAMVKLPGGEEINIVDEMNYRSGQPPVPVDDGNQNLNPEQASPGNSNSKSKTISGGVLNGKAISLPEPVYPPTAKAAHASGTVVVQVAVDETGKVISATAVSGHPLLQDAAKDAAYKARFKPTLISGKPVLVTGTITYDFVADK
jgi:TonB family protein